MENSLVLLGCGSVGSFLSQYAIRSSLFRYETIYLVDNDRVEEKNLGNQAYSGMDVGRAKTRALSDQILGLRPDIPVVTISERLSFANAKAVLRKALAKGCDIVCCFDNIESRLVAKSLGFEYDLNVLHVATSPDWIVAMWNDAYYPSESGEDACEFGNVTISVLAALTGLEALERYWIAQETTNFVVSTRSVASQTHTS